jgi:hypothetical protein
MDWRILVNCIRQSMLKHKTHSGFHDLFLKYHFDRIVGVLVSVLASTMVDRGFEP